MNKALPLVLAALAAAPAAADVNFDRGVDVAAAVSSAREALQVPVGPPSFTLMTPSESRHDELIRRRSEWPARKTAMQSALNQFYQGITAERGDDTFWYQRTKKVWALALQVEAVHGWAADRFLERLDAEISDQAEHDRRWNAVLVLRDFRRFVLYGELIPRVIDESVRDASGNPIGRRYAAPSWSSAMTFDEAMAIDAELRAKTGFTEAEYQDMQKRANDVLARP